jgi:hypothetical protein
MRRRDVVAGLGSLGVLGGAGYVVQNGPPSFALDTESEDSGEDDDADEDDGPAEVETVDAHGSEDGSLTVPSADATVLMFFVSGCGNCQAQVSRLTEARERLQADHGDAATFLSITYESDEQFPPAELREWWDEHGGDGFVSYDSSTLPREYSAVGYPVTLVVDADGTEHWREVGVTDSNSIVSAAEDALEASAENSETADEDGNETDEDGNETNTADGAENETDD